MGAAARPLEESGDEDFFVFEDYAADRADAVPASAEAVNAAPDVHKTVFAAVQGGEGQGADELAFVQFCGTNRAGLGLAGETFAPGLRAPAPAGPARPCEGRDAHAEEKGVAEPEQGDPNNHKNQNL